MWWSCGSDQLPHTPTLIMKRWGQIIRHSQPGNSWKNSHIINDHFLAVILQHSKFPVVEKDTTIMKGCNLVPKPRGSLPRGLGTRLEGVEPML